MTTNRQQAIEEQAQREVTIAIKNASGVTLNINNFSLDAGSWDNPPDLGHAITPGDTPSYVNFTDQPFTDLGGSINLIPTIGGKVDIKWIWKWGSAASNNVSCSNIPDLSINGYMTNQNTNSPTLHVHITNAPN